jgi:hypothetical protein
MADEGGEIIIRIDNAYMPPRMQRKKKKLTVKGTEEKKYEQGITA